MDSKQHRNTLKYGDTSAGQIAYTDIGSGDVVLFIHAMPMCTYQWQDIASRLSDSYRCIAVDQLGLGYSKPKPGQDKSFASQASSISELLDSLEIDKIHLVGNDTGGGICQVFAASNHDRVSSLTITNCEVSDLWPNDFLTTFYDGLESGEFGEQTRAMVADPSLASAGLGALVYEDPSKFDEESVSVCLAPLVSSNERLDLFRSLADYWQTNRSQLVAASEGLETLTAPSQIVWGLADIVFDAEPSIEWLESHLSNHKRTTKFESGKLFFPNEHPRSFADLLRKFLIEI